MAGVKGKSGPPQNQNAFKHGLAAIEGRRQDGVTTDREDSIRAEILAGLIQDKGGEAQISTATRILAEVIAADAAWLVVFNQAIDNVIANNPKARQNPRGLSQLDGYKRPLVNSLTTNIAKYGMGRVGKVETLQEIIDEMTEHDETGENSSPGCPKSGVQRER